MMLQAIAKRIHFGKFVAEAKFREQPSLYEPLIKAQVQKKRHLVSPSNLSPNIVLYRIVSYRIVVCRGIDFGWLDVSLIHEPTWHSVDAGCGGAFETAHV